MGGTRKTQIFASGRSRPGLRSPSPPTEVGSQGGASICLTRGQGAHQKNLSRAETGPRKEQRRLRSAPAGDRETCSPDMHLAFPHFPSHLGAGAREPHGRAVGARRGCPRLSAYRGGGWPGWGPLLQLLGEASRPPTCWARCSLHPGGLTLSGIQGSLSGAAGSVPEVPPAPPPTAAPAPQLHRVAKPALNTSSEEMQASAVAPDV